MSCILADLLDDLYYYRNTNLTKGTFSKDMYAQNSIELLTKSGIDFKKHEEYGIDVQDFGELLISSGLVLSNEIKWISFHRYSSCLRFIHISF